ncbi:hypothetical protein ABFT80_06115 [Mesorhizobium sp. SB112]|uniref:hypothetical protein n=1 Tax=Mesorhizobium sp. SB112 TaxID=3151853 RepID=UPI0032660704
MESNFEAFNQVVGLIFDQLYRKFPIAVEIDHDEIAEKLGIAILPYDPPSMVITIRTKIYGEIAPSTNMEDFVNEAIEFLAVEGFLQRDGYSIRLSAKALTLLNAPLPGLEKPAGAQIVEISKNVGTAAGKAAIGEIVGQVIGAAARGFWGS